MTSVLYANCEGVLPFFIGIHIDVKELLKRLALTRKSAINLLLAGKRY